MPGYFRPTRSFGYFAIATASVNRRVRAGHAAAIFWSERAVNSFFRLRPPPLIWLTLGL
jgi:hypothetical protein